MTNFIKYMQGILNTDIVKLPKLLSLESKLMKIMDPIKYMGISGKNTNMVFGCPGEGFHSKSPLVPVYYHKNEAAIKYSEAMQAVQESDFNCQIKDYLLQDIEKKFKEMIEKADY